MAVPDGGRRCSGCGTPLDLDARFCGGCGTPIDATTSGPPQSAERNAVRRPGRWGRERLVSLAGLGTVLLVVGVVLVVLPRAGGDLPSEASAQFAFSDDSYAASGRAGSSVPVNVAAEVAAGLSHLTFVAALEGQAFELVVLNEPGEASADLEELIEFAVPVEARPGLDDSGTHVGEIIAVACTKPLVRSDCPDGAEVTAAATVTLHIDPLDSDGVPDGFSIPHAGRFATTDDGGIVADELLLLTDRGLDASEAAHTALEVAESVDALVTGADASAGIFQLAFTSQAHLDSARHELGELPGVELALPHSLAISAGLPDDYGDEPWMVDEPQGRNWHLEAIDAPSAWDHHIGSDELRVGIIDWGFRPAHEDLRDNVRRHVTYGVSDPGATHGTHVAGIACARGNNTRGISGVTQRCALHLYELPAPGELGIPEVAILQAMRDAARDEIDVVNLSVGIGPGVHCETEPDEGLLAHVMKRSRPYRYTIDDVRDAGRDILWVFSAGNGCKEAIYQIPAALGVEDELDNVMVVAAVNSDDTLMPASNYGDAVSVAAPGGWDMRGLDGRNPTAALNREFGVWSTWPCVPAWEIGWPRPPDGQWCWALDDAYRGHAGTSMAAPVVTGLAALSRAAAPDTTAAKIRMCIVSAAQASDRRAQHPPDWLRPDLPRRFTDEDLAALPIVNAGSTLDCMTEAAGPDADPATGDSRLLVANQGWEGISVADLMSGERVVLTNDGRHARWSPDRSQIAFVRGPAQSSASEIWIMNADGTDQRLLTEGSSPSWSPDGTQIGFTRVHGPEGEHLSDEWWKSMCGEIRVISADGSDERALIDNAYGARMAVAWSPVGDKLVFFAGGASTTPGCEDGLHGFHVLDIEGTIRARAAVSAQSIDWSPDGATLLIQDDSAYGPGWSGTVVTVTSNGLHAERLFVPSAAELCAENTSCHHTPRWSPDGTEIAYAVRYDAGSHLYDIWLANADGTNRRATIQESGMLWDW